MVSALGYFVDIYDLILFSIVRVPSLKSMGFSDAEVMSHGVTLINLQMIGMLVGGLLWGIWGDKRGRVSVLFGSILLYSLANILNAFVTTIEAYGALRFIAGVGLAGELGAAITLVSETMSKEKRGYGTAVVASVGILGAVAAALIGDAFHWKIAYIVGGVLGLLLLFMRMKMFESGMFSAIKQNQVKRGDFLALLKDNHRLRTYLGCVLLGVPIWFVIGILVTFSPEISKEMNLTEAIAAGKAVMYCYLGLAIGDLVSGLLSQWFKSRKKIALAFVLLTAISTALYGQVSGITSSAFYALCLLLGFATGYWAVFITIASEQFGTNLRSTVTTTVPNFVRGSLVPLTLGFRYFSQSMTLVQSAMLIGAIAVFLALVGLYFLKETYGKDLDYIEDI